MEAKRKQLCTSLANKNKNNISEESSEEDFDPSGLSFRRLTSLILKVILMSLFKTIYRVCKKWRILKQDPVETLKTKRKCKRKNSLEGIFYITVKWCKYIITLWEDQGSQDVTYSTGNTKTAPCDTTVNSDQHSAHSSSLTVVLCSRPVVVRHQQERVSKMNFTLHEYCDVYLILGACGNRTSLQPGRMQKGIQHAAIQTVMCLAGWTRG
jgi:hypothetical protein